MALRVMVAATEAAKTSQILVLLFRATHGNDSIRTDARDCALESKKK
jgi:hypothetical protein